MVQDHREHEGADHPVPAQHSSVQYSTVQLAALALVLDTDTETVLTRFMEINED